MTEPSDQSVRSLVENVVPNQGDEVVIGDYVVKNTGYWDEKVKPTSAEIMRVVESLDDPALD